jgi:hypothetical protein
MTQRILTAGVPFGVALSMAVACSNDRGGNSAQLTAPSAVAQLAAGKGAGAPVIRQVPSAGEPGAPFYTPVFINGPSGFVPTDGTWVGIHFYRDPSCIPGDFNLLKVFDPPAAFGCSLTITGETWRHESDDRAPFQEHYSGAGAVPIYFVRLTDLSAATGDDVLTIGELHGIALVGHASFYRGVIHNSSQAANHGHETVTARGQLENGRSFHFHFDEKFLDGRHVFQSVRIEFR